MPETLRETVHALVDAWLDSADRLMARPQDLAAHSSHDCGHDEDNWRLVTNLIDHETKHIQQVHQARYNVRDMRMPVERLTAEWLEIRARFIGSLVGLSDEQFNAPTGPGEWSYREIAEHLLWLEQDALETMDRDVGVSAAAV